MYVKQLNVSHILYIITSYNENLLINCVYKSKALLNKKFFNKVYKTVNIKTEKLCAIKQLLKEEENKTTED